MPLLQLTGLSKSFDESAVRGVSLDLDQGDILCLLGPSGCGKTTLLRMVAGLEAPDTGRVIFNGKDVTRLSPQARKFGLMFQEFALFPHQSVYENVAFGLKMQKLTPGRIEQRVGDVLGMMGITDLASRNVAKLSGGERQRVALARSLAPQPKLLMLDEPLGSLDRALRERLVVEIRCILKKLNATAIFVTHDQAEAFAMADQIAVMNQGRLEQVAEPEDLYLRPGSRFVAGFMGFKNFIPAEVIRDDTVSTPLGEFTASTRSLEPGQDATLLIRPEGAKLAVGDPPSPGHKLISGQVLECLFSGACYRLRLQSDDGSRLSFDLDNQTKPPHPGERATLQISPSCVVLLKDV
jgi:ABC-type Fe3+/spermidine/putrescine transport system ATPase subunit